MCTKVNELFVKTARLYAYTETCVSANGRKERRFLCKPSMDSFSAESYTECVAGF